MNNTNCFDLPLNQLPVISLEGSFREMGRQYGEICREKMTELYELRLQSALKHARVRGRGFDIDAAIAIAGESTEAVKTFDPSAFEELQGISEGSGLSIEQLYILHGLTDFRDYLSWGTIPDGLGCTSLIIPKERSSTGELILAQNWDLLTTNMPYVCFVKRKPNEGPSSMSLTVAGGLSMIGMNSEGVCIGTNNIKTTDSRKGVHYLNLIHKAMSCSTTAEVQQMIDTAERAGAHYYMIGDRNGDYAGLECSATRAGLIRDVNGVVTHCNHPLEASVAELNAEDMGPSTFHRQSRIDTLVNEGKIGIEEIKDMLADLDGDQLAICRYDVGEGISTNACVIMEPESGRVHACRSQPQDAEWLTFSI